MPEEQQQQQPRAFITATTSQEGVVTFNCGGQWTDLFILHRMIGIAVDDYYRSEQMKAATQAQAAAAEKARPAPSTGFAKRREQKAKRK